MQLHHHCHLTYCTNIHPGEEWSPFFEALQHSLPQVKSRFCPDQPMGVGLRLSAVAAHTLAQDPVGLSIFQQWLNETQLYVFTINGFPYGKFHSAPVKQAVYQPDWTTPERVVYTETLATLLAALLPAGMHGSISTVPVGFKPDLLAQGKLETAVQNLLKVAAALYHLHQKTGHCIHLALEPEPGCFLETTSETVDFFTTHLFSEGALERWRELVFDARGGDEKDRQSLSLASLKQYLGVCLDTCHAAVMYESSRAAAEMLVEAGVPIHKVQLSSALQVHKVDDVTRTKLASFAEGVYLHQSNIRENNSTEFFLDLPEALAAVQSHQELRSHFHVPVFFQSVDGLGTTQADLIEFLAAQNDNIYSTHLEVETYTFGVLPEPLKTATIEDSIARELDWVLERLR